MSKDPAFLFYSKDWIEGTIEMLPQEKGVYIDLLAHQHQKGSLPTETKRLCRLVCMQEDEFLKIWEHIKNKFVEIQIDGQPNGIPNGSRLVNQKLIDLSDKRKNDAFLKKISGIFASLIKSTKCTNQEKEYIKERFNVSDFKGISEDKLKDEITDWFTNCIKNTQPNGLPNGLPNNNHMLTSLAIANANNNNTVINNNLNKEITNSNSWGNEKNYFLNDEQFLYKIATSYAISNKDVIAFANCFLKELELAEDYKDSKELKRHFSYWIKKRKDENEKKSKYQQPDPTKVKIKLPNSPTPRYD